MEITQAGPVVRVTVADSGGSAEPRMIEEPTPEHGKRLPLMRGLRMRTGVCGDDRGLWSGPISAGTARLQRPKRQDTMRPVLRSATASPRCRWARQRPGPGGPRCCVGHAQMRVGRCSQAPRAWSLPLTAGQLCGYRRVCSRPTHRCRRNRCAIIPSDVPSAYLHALLSDRLLEGCRPGRRSMRLPALSNPSRQPSPDRESTGAGTMRSS